MIRLLGAATLLTTSVLLAAGCSSEEDGTNGGNGGAGNSGGTFNISGSGNRGGGDAGDPSSCLVGPDEEECVGEQYAGETIPLDVYIMFDQSCSMSCDIDHEGCCSRENPEEQDVIRIEPIREALNQFLTDPKSHGIGVGIGYFGHRPGGQTSCEGEDYAAAAVPIQPLPGNYEALSSSVNSVVPTGETPTGPAIRGACSYAADWKQKNPGRAVVILLVTDGVPETPDSHCFGENPSAIEDAMNAASECASANTPIKTYVLGIGHELDTLNGIAREGGTRQAYLVEGGDVSRAVLQALNAIRADATIPCEFKIPQPPDGRTLDYNLVNVGICDASGAPTQIYFASSPEACGDNPGWYYDDSTGERRIRLCEASCETVSVPGAQLYYSVGCETKPVPVE